MKLAKVIKSLNLQVLAGKDFLDEDVAGGYAGDMLSDVLAHALKGSLWVTMQIHPNVLAVASTKGLAGIIVVQGRRPEADILMKAEQKKIPILASPLSTYTVVGRLYEIGLR